MNKKAILVVSFGTSHADTREKTIERIEQDIQQQYPQYTVYRAFTSKMIIKILNDRDQVHVCTVAEAMGQMKEDGIEEVIVQPTHILNGIENDRMIEDANLYRRDFKSISFGAPLLNDTDDYWKVIDAFVKKLPALDEQEAIVCMGHGTEHYTNSSYAALDYMFKAAGHRNIYVATVEGYPLLADIMKPLKAGNYKKIYLMPLMIVSGDHAKNDMAGEEEDSWKTILEKEGFEVACILKGLGENAGIRKILVEHVETAK